MAANLQDTLQYVQLTGSHFDLAFDQNFACASCYYDVHSESVKSVRGQKTAVEQHTLN